MPNLFSVLSGWLMTHLVALGFLGFLAVAVVAKGPLFGLEDWPMRAVAPSPATPEPTRQDEPVRAAAAEERAETQEPAPDDPGSPVAEPVATGIPTATDGSVPETSSSGTRQPVFRPTQPDVSDHQQFVPLSVAKDPGKEAISGDVRESEDVLPAPQDNREGLDRLERARAAFWAGELERAEKLYLEYLALEPADAATFGELGNLYQSMGRPGDALDAYYEAGIRFRSQGDQERLEQIVELLSETGDPRAAQLRN